MRRIGIILILILNSLPAQEPAIKVGFDIDDTVLYSEAIFVQPRAKQNGHLDFAWINQQDRKLSVPITPTLDLIHYFEARKIPVYFITGRHPENGNDLADYLTGVLGFPVKMNENLFFSHEAMIYGKTIQGKAAIMQTLGISVYYGDADSDILDALAAHVQPVRIVRYSASVDQYSRNYFGDTQAKRNPETPWDSADLSIFLKSHVGPFGEPIYPIIWEGPEGN